MDNHLQVLVSKVEHDIDDFAQVQHLDGQARHELLYMVVTMLLDREDDQ